MQLLGYMIILKVTDWAVLYIPVSMYVWFQLTYFFKFVAGLFWTVLTQSSLKLWKQMESKSQTSHNKFLFIYLFIYIFIFKINFFFQYDYLGSDSMIVTNKVIDIIGLVNSVSIFLFILLGKIMLVLKLKFSLTWLLFLSNKSHPRELSVDLSKHWINLLVL